MQVKDLQLKRVLRTALLVLLLGAAGMTKGYAYSFSAVCSTGQRLYYTITDATNHYVSVVPPLSNGWGSSTKPTGSLIIPEIVTRNSVDYSVTAIGGNAFSACSGLTDLTIPNSVTSIGNSAFYGCSGLNTVYWYAVDVTSYSSAPYHPFYNCTSLTTVVFGNQVQTIPSSAFTGFSSLTDLTIGNSVTSIGNSAFASCSGLTGSLTIPNSVTSIGNYAFRGCTCLTNLTIGNSVTSIGNFAFSGCSGLTTVNWNAVNVTSYQGYILNNDNNYPFANCTSLTSVVFGDYVQTIPNYAFYGFSSLTDLTIGHSMTSIGNYAFYHCSGLESVHYTGDIAQWCNIEFSSNPLSYAHNLYIADELVTNLEIPDSVTEIKNSAFLGCTCLTNLTIGNSVTSIGNSAFSGCSGLTGSLTIPNSVTSIGNYAFYGCSGLTGLTVGDSVATIGDYAFYDCSGLTGSLTIGNSVVSIGNYAFRNCNGLTGLTVGDSVTTIGEYAFYDCSGLTGLTIGNSVTNIGKYAFYECSGLIGSLTIPNSVTSIGYRSFQNCNCITNLTIGSSVTSIGTDAFKNCCGLTAVNWNAVNVTSYPGESYGGAFKDCTNLTSVVFSDQVQTIPEMAFWSCSSLTDLTIGVSVTTIGSWAFENCSELTAVNWNAVNVTSYPGSDYYYYPFRNCPSLITVVFGNQVQRIPAYAFRGRSSITDLTIGNSVISIGSSAFSGCSGLTGTLAIPNSVTSIGDYAFSGCSGFDGTLTIPNSVTSIGVSSFSGCCGLTGLTIGNSVTSIGDDAFYNCSGLTTVNWNAVNVTSYPMYSDYSHHPFKNCTNLTSVVFGNQVQTIPDYAFSYCSGLTGLTIGNSVTSIGKEAFENCRGLEAVHYTGDIAQWCNIEYSIYAWGYRNPLGYAHNLYIDDELVTDLVIPESVTEIKNYTFEGCTCLSSLTLPNTVTTIGYFAFSGCSGLEAVYYTGDIAQWCNIEFTSISSNPLYWAHNLYVDDELVTDLVIPESVTEIKNHAFYGCSCLTSLSIPNSVASIGSSAFYGCSGLTGTLNIGNSVTSIGDYAFYNCTGINAIRLQCPAPPTIYQNSFNGVDKSIPVFVACGTQEAYLAADYWPEFTTINESPYDLIITQNDPYGGEVSVVHYADCDDNHCAILAINNIGYNFIGWFVNDYFSTDSPYCDFSLIDNVTFEARFERKPDHFITIVTSTSNTWSDPDTWDTGEVPSATSTVGIYKDIIVDVDAEVEQMRIYDNGSITISPDVTLTVTDELESDTTISIVIEDGGQLYHSNDEVVAMVKKTVEAYNATNDNWNLISFPLANMGYAASVMNLFSNEYDLYYYDEPTAYWINQEYAENGFDQLEAGKGYLYANSGVQNCVFDQAVYVTDRDLIDGHDASVLQGSQGTTGYNVIHNTAMLADDFVINAATTINAIEVYAFQTNSDTVSTMTGLYVQIYNGNPMDGGQPIWGDANVNIMTTTSWSNCYRTGSNTNTNRPIMSVTADNLNIELDAGIYYLVWSLTGSSSSGPWGIPVAIPNIENTGNGLQYWQGSWNYALDSGTEQGVGFAFRLFGTSDQTATNNAFLSFIGELENGSAEVTVPLDYTETAGNLKGFNLVGNPFVHNVTTYASMNVAEGCFRLNETKDNLIVSEVSETLPLKPAEGFFVKATAEGASITFNPGRSRGETERKCFVNLELRENGKLIDRLIVKREGEPLEKLTLKGNGTRLYAMQDRQEMAIVSCKGNEQPVNFKATRNGSYTINVNTDYMDFTYLHLIDNLTGNDVNLLVEPNYSFEAKTTDYASRFKLVFATGSSEDSESDAFAFINGSGNLTIFGIEGEATLQVLDVLGHVFSSEQFSGSYEKKLDVAPGVYMLRLINGNDVKVQKIVVR